ncbi:hypothetical protein [Actinomadura formosensis]|uniref:hypothetical protein n=1 Tax=Actinomadura formosensis TaxID=60706 RepID=UPI003898EF4F
MRAHQALVVGRRINDQAYASVLGERDWLFPTHRDTVSIVGRGVDPVDALVLLRGDWHSGYDPAATRVAPQRRRSRRNECGPATPRAVPSAWRSCASAGCGDGHHGRPP